MSRSGYYDDGDNWSLIKWRGAVQSAIRGARGQALLRDLRAALDAMPVKRLIVKQLELNGEVCALGAVAQHRGVTTLDLDPENSEDVAERFNIANALAKEIVFENDEAGTWSGETAEQRWERMSRWCDANLFPVKP